MPPCRLTWQLYPCGGDHSGSIRSRGGAGLAWTECVKEDPNTSHRPKTENRPYHKIRYEGGDLTPHGSACNGDTHYCIHDSCAHLARRWAPVACIFSISNSVNIDGVVRVSCLISQVGDWLFCVVPCRNFTGRYAMGCGPNGLGWPKLRR